MAGREKEKKAKIHQLEVEEEKDRLSDLPDGILLHILSFLPETKWCIRTSVLGKRWKSLWNSVPNLIFIRQQSRSHLSFQRFVSHVLSRRDNLPLTQFSFDCYQQDKSFIPRIINYAVSHNVQHLHFRIVSSLTILFPLLNNCPSLKSLNLEYFKDLHLLKDFTLRSLITLHLFHCDFCDFWAKNEPTSIDPFVGLVNLKTLLLSDCGLGRTRKFMISGAESLTIRSKTYISCYNGCQIFAPKLRFLTLHNILYLPNVKFPVLETADFVTNLPHLSKKRLKALIYMFRGLWNIQSLVISSNIIKGLIAYPDVLENQVSPFVKLKTLKVKCSSSSSFNIPDNVMNYFVSASSYGENLTLKFI